MIPPSRLDPPTPVRSRWRRSTLGAALLSLVAAVPLTAQDARSDPLPQDSAALRERAHEVQASFEAYREARIPPATVLRGGGCDERIGRFCLRHDGDEAPIPDEPPEIGLARRETLRELARISARIPGDDWVFGQRVFYSVESGDFRGAEMLARRCPGPSPWWCDALLGLVLHHSQRFVSSDSAYSAALGSMPAQLRRWYRTPEFVLDREGRELFEERDYEGREDLWTRLWLLSDPLYLVEGNDRLTAHFARKTLVRVRTGTLTAYGLPFDEDPDLEELNIRYGGERGYERIQTPPRGGPGAGGLVDTRRVVGRHAPDDREYLPTSSFLRDPAEIPPGAWTLEEAEPRTGYTAPYAPVMRPLQAQVARFRRADSLLVVASYRAAIPTPSSSQPSPREARRGDDGPGNPFLGGGDDGWIGDEDEIDAPVARAGGDDGGGGAAGAAEPVGRVESGLFLLAWDGTSARRIRGEADAAVVTATVPDGEYVLGVEAREEETGRAWRLRQGIRQESLVPGLAAVSDLLFLRPGEALPESLEEALPRAMPAIRIAAGESFTVAWEVYGLRPGETAGITLGFTEGEPGLLERVGEFLRIVEPEAPVEISFEERAPDGLGVVFRALDVDVPSFEPGVYALHLQVELPGRAPMVTSRRLVVD